MVSCDPDLGICCFCTVFILQLGFVEIIWRGTDESELGLFIFNFQTAGQLHN